MQSSEAARSDAKASVDRRRHAMLYQPVTCFVIVSDIKLICKIYQRVIWIASCFVDRTLSAGDEKVTLTKGNNYQ